MQLRLIQRLEIVYSIDAAQRSIITPLLQCPVSMCFQGMDSNY